ncbi:hypothetical protein ACTPEC_11695 [Clostridioides difficile]
MFDKNILSTSAFIIFVGAGLNTFSSYVSSQDIVQRFTTTTDIKQLNKMTYGNGVLSMGLATVFYLIGTCLFIYLYSKSRFSSNSSTRPSICIIYSL